MTAPTKEHILEAAARLYGEHGFRGTTTRRIAQEAGVNEVTLFRRFGSKTALLLEALRVHGVEPVRAELPAVPADPLAELTEWCTHKRRAISSMRSIIRKAMSEFEENPAMPKCITQGASTTYASLREYLGRLHDAGLTSPKADLNTAASMLISTVFHDAIARDMMPHAFPQPSSGAPAMYAALCLNSLGFDAASQKGSARSHGHGRRRALLAGAALLLAGGITPLRAQQGVQGPPPPRTTALSLQQALELGSRVSHTVKTAEAGVLRARGGEYQARAQYLPQVNGSLAYQRLLQSQFAAIAGSSDTTSSGSGGGSGSGSGSGSSNNFQSIEKIFAAPNSMILGLTLTQNLFTAGRLSAAKQGALAARTSADIGLDAAHAQVWLDVAQAYFDAVASDKVVEIEDSTLAQAERTLQQTTVSRQVGAAAEFDLLRARVARDNQRPVVIQAKNNRDIAYMRLRQLLGIPQGEPLSLTTAISDGGAADSTSTSATFGGGISYPAGMKTPPDTTVNARSSVRQAEANVTAQEYALRAARWERLPSAQLSSTYQRYGYPADAALLQNLFGAYYPNWTVSFGLSVPLFLGGKLTGDRMVAEANLAEARQSLDQVKELAELDAHTAMSQLTMAEASYDASVGTDTQAARAYSIAEVRFQEGISTQVELQQSRTQYEQARLNRVLAARDLEVARLRVVFIRDLPVAATPAPTIK
ncbi:MAG: TolC family protein [Gemmatimonadales bacterium]